MNKEELIQQALGFNEQIYSLINNYSFENWLSLDLSIGQLKSLVYIRYRGKASHSEISRVLNVTPSVVTGIIDRLECGGLVTRQNDDVDRRVHWLALTDKGRDIFNKFDQKSKNEINRVLSTLNENELKALVDSFSCFLAACKAHLETSNRALTNKAVL